MWQDNEVHSGSILLASNEERITKFVGDVGSVNFPSVHLLMLIYVCHFPFWINHGLMWACTLFWGFQIHNQAMILFLFWWTNYWKWLISLLAKRLLMQLMWLNCTFRKSTIFMDWHYPLFLIGTNGSLATFRDICGVCLTPSLILAVLIILKRRWSIVLWGFASKFGRQWT